MVKLREQYRYLLEQIVENSEEKIGHFSLATGTSRGVSPKPLEELDHRWEGAVHTQFSRQAQHHPQPPAVQDDHAARTYAGPEAISSQEYDTPRTKTENHLTSIWEEVSGREKMGSDDDFFEPGEHSLPASLTAIVPGHSQLSKEISFPGRVNQIKPTTLEAYDHGRSSNVIPLSLLYRIHPDRFVLRVPKHTLRLFTWLINRT